MTKRKPHSLPLSLLKPYFRKPIHIASKELSVSCSLLRNSLKSYGIQKWPYRYFQRLDRAIAFLKNMEIEQRKHKNEMGVNVKRINGIRRMTEVFIQKREELEYHPELLSIREQEELETTPQKIEFLISNSLEASVEDASSDSKSTQRKTEGGKCHAFNTGSKYYTSDFENFENFQTFNPDKDISSYISRVESKKDECNLNFQKQQRMEDPCRTFAEFLIKLGEEGIRNLQPSTILDLAKTYYSESLRLEGVNCQI
ncbi:hypothetical protein Gasu2_23880 [Galdieria sulphuraria]|nr:hypothetical protein Gasu2_23880 [Galdieria sulphuraria]